VTPIDLVWLPRAEEDLLDIYVAIGRHNPAAAEKTYASIEAHIRHLADHPRLGPRRPDIHPSMRILVDRPYVVLYETVPDVDDSPIDRVVIVRVLDGRRNLPRLLRETED
jgi:toxin ParE1/3/4